MTQTMFSGGDEPIEVTVTWHDATGHVTAIGVRNLSPRSVDLVLDFGDRRVTVPIPAGTVLTPAVPGSLGTLVRTPDGRLVWPWPSAELDLH